MATNQYQRGVPEDLAACGPAAVELGSAWLSWVSTSVVSREVTMSITTIAITR